MNELDCAGRRAESAQIGYARASTVDGSHIK